MDASERIDQETVRLANSGLLNLSIGDLRLRRQYAASRLKLIEQRANQARREVADIDIAIRRAQG